MQLVNAINAYQYVLKTLKDKEKFSWKNVIGVNKDERGNPRYYIILEDSGNNIFIKFSREPYMSGVGGYKESTNTKNGVKECFKYKVNRMFFCYPDGKIYWIKILDFMKLAEKRITNNENRSVYVILLKNLERY